MGRSLLTMGYIPAVLVFVILVSMASPLSLPLAFSAAFLTGFVPQLYSYLLSNYTAYQAVLVCCTVIPIGTYWLNGLCFLMVTCANDLMCSSHLSCSLPKHPPSLPGTQLLCARWLPICS